MIFLIVAVGGGAWFASGRLLRRLEHSSGALARARRAALDWPEQPIPGSIAVVGIAAIFVTSFAVFVSEASSTDAHEIVAHVIMIVLSAPIAILHRVPGSNRALKYALVLTVLGVFWLKLIALQVLSERHGLEFLRILVKDLHSSCGNLYQKYIEEEMIIARHQIIIHNEVIPFENQVLWWKGAGFLNFAIPSGIAVVVAIAVVIFVRHAASILGIHRLIVVIGRYLFVVAAIVMESVDSARILWAESVGFVLMVSYLVARYEVMERVARQPLLYLRSFSSHESAMVYSKLVAPVASKYGVLLGVVHETQSPGELFAHVHPTLRARLLGCPAQEWQPWVETLLRRANAVIVDLTHSTPGVQWELTAAQRILPACRILTIGPGNSVQIADQFLSWKDSRQFRRRLQEWFIQNMGPQDVTKHIGRLFMILIVIFIGTSLMSRSFKDRITSEESRLNSELDDFESYPEGWNMENCPQYNPKSYEHSLLYNLDRLDSLRYHKSLVSLRKEEIGVAQPGASLVAQDGEVAPC